MSKRNANGEGSIYQRKDGRWCAAITVGYNPNGSQKKKYIYGKERNEVFQKLIELQNDIVINGGYVRDDTITLSQWSEKYLKEFVKNTVRAGTYDSYDVILRNHINNSELATMKLKDIKAYHLQAYINSKSHMSKSYIKKIHLLLNMFFDGAVKNDLIKKNPVLAINIPRSEKDTKEIEILSREEQSAYMSAIGDSSFKPLLITALFTGMRLGELIALKWDNVNLTSNEIKVSASARETRIDGEWKLIRQAPKTKSGIRTIPIPETLSNDLKALKHKQENIQIEHDSYNKDNHVFCSTIGSVLSPRNVQRAHYKVCDNAKINRVGFHALRHTFATRMIEEGVDVKTVQYWMGHATIQMTYNIYVHVQEQTKKAAATVQDNLLKSFI